jgi:dethiobiotin synthetase
MPNIDAQDFVIVESDGGLFSWLAQQKSLGDVLRQRNWCRIRELGRKNA